MPLTADERVGVVSSVSMGTASVADWVSRCWVLRFATWWIRINITFNHMARHNLSMFIYLVYPTVQWQASTNIQCHKKWLSFNWNHLYTRQPSHSPKRGGFPLLRYAGNQPQLLQIGQTQNKVLVSNEVSRLVDGGNLRQWPGDSTVDGRDTNKIRLNSTIAIYARVRVRLNSLCLDSIARFLYYTHIICKC